jgi:hypothetical protein
MITRCRVSSARPVISSASMVNCSTVVPATPPWQLFRSCRSPGARLKQCANSARRSQGPNRCLGKRRDPGFASSPYRRNTVPIVVSSGKTLPCATRRNHILLQLRRGRRACRAGWRPASRASGCRARCPASSPCRAHQLSHAGFHWGRTRRTPYGASPRLHELNRPETPCQSPEVAPPVVLREVAALVREPREPHDLIVIAGSSRR